MQMRRQTPRMRHATEVLQRVPSSPPPPSPSGQWWKETTVTFRDQVRRGGMDRFAGPRRGSVELHLTTMVRYRGCSDSREHHATAGKGQRTRRPQGLKRDHV